MKGRKKVVYLGAVILGLLLIVPTINVLGTEEKSIKKSVTVVNMNATPTNEMLPVTKTTKAIPINDEQNIGTRGTDIQVTSTSETENNPAIGAVPTGELLVSYTHVIDVSTNDVVWDFSLDGGQTWDGGQYFLIDGAESHPAIDY